MAAAPFPAPSPPSTSASGSRPWRRRGGRRRPGFGSLFGTAAPRARPRSTGNVQRRLPRPARPGGFQPPPAESPVPSQRLVAKTSLSSPPWPEVKLPDPLEEAKYHAEVVQKVNEMIATGQYGRLFAVVHFASKQWKVTSEDLIMMDNVLEAECGDRIRMEKVLLVGADDFTLIGRPLLGKDLVRVEATVIEKTESWPKINMRFWKRHNYQRKKIIRNPQAVLRINTIDIFPSLS
uniref:Large ribosomal subunit protein bL21m n=1 Tax=Apteryx owenii TaxID=8824 RepID=A0A8B9PP50_APTOW